MNSFGIEPVPRVLYIPELLRRIFELSTNEANIAHAAVCKTWSEEATSVVWRNVSTDRLFSLLAPLTAPNGGIAENHSFAREIDEDDWDRFDRYSHKVRVLRFNREYDPSVFKEIALGRRRLDFLPNLVSLYNAQPTLLFAYSTIKHLIFTEGMFCDDKIIAWLGIIERRMCYIEQLWIEAYNHELLSDVQTAFTSALKRMKRLKELGIPTEFLNDSNFHILPSIPSLQRLNCDCPYWSHPRDNFSARSLSEFPTDPFRSLREFAVHLPFKTAMIYIPTLNGFQMLRVLKITSGADESFDDYIILLDVISLHCPKLKTLKLAMDNLPAGSAVTARMTHYACRLRNMLRSFQQLESLTLQDFGLQGSVPLGDLPHFSHPSLAFLHLDIDSAMASDEEIPCEFPALKTLHFGPSSTQITHPTEVASFLSRILPPGCKISAESGSDVEDGNFHQVQTWVPILIKARIEGRAAAMKAIKVEESSVAAS